MKWKNWKQKHNYNQYLDYNSITVFRILLIITIVLVVERIKKYTPTIKLFGLSFICCSSMYVTFYGKKKVKEKSKAEGA